MKRLALGLAALAACAGPASPRAPTSPVVARVDGAPITEDVVRATALREGVGPREALRLLVDEALLAGEARRRSLGPRWLEDDARWHARVRKLLEDAVEARHRADALPPEQVEEYVAARRAAVCHDGLRRVVHAVFLARGDARPEGRRLRLEAAAALRQRIVASRGARPSEADLRQVAALVSPQPPQVEGLSPMDRLGGLSTGGNVVEPFARAVWSIPADAPLSEAFETSFGVHVVLLLEEVPPSGVSCASVRPALVAELERRLRSTEVQTLLQRLRAAAVIRVDTGALRGARSAAR
ncbi:MAG: hypothetical protein U0325_21530 [Polyangiales bacterium]